MLLDYRNIVIKRMGVKAIGSTAVCLGGAWEIFHRL